MQFNAGRLISLLQAASDFIHIVPTSDSSTFCLTTVFPCLLIQTLSSVYVPKSARLWTNSQSSLHQHWSYCVWTSKARVRPRDYSDVAQRGLFRINVQSLCCPTRKRFSPGCRDHKQPRSVWHIFSSLCDVAVDNIMMSDNYGFF